MSDQATLYVLTANCAMWCSWIGYYLWIVEKLAETQDSLSLYWLWDFYVSKFLGFLCAMYVHSYNKSRY